MTDRNELVRLIPNIERDALDVNYDVARIDRDKLLRALERCFDSAAVFVAEEDDNIVGIMVLYLVELYWTDAHILTNLIYWVDVEHRKSRHGAELLEAAKDYARERGTDFDLCVESYKDLDRKDAFFKRRGFTPRGGNYKYKVT